MKKSYMQFTYNGIDAHRKGEWDKKGKKNDALNYQRGISFAREQMDMRVCPSNYSNEFSYVELDSFLG